MANYYGVMRTNYFKVTDEAKFRKIIGHISCEDKIHIFHDKSDNTFGFGAYGNFDSYIYSDDDIDNNEGDIYVAIEKLQEILPKDEVIALIEIGNENLRTLIGQITIITNNNYKMYDLYQLSADIAKQLLGKDTPIIF